MDTALLDILVCPLCKSPLRHDREKQELVCKQDRVAYPIRDGIPIMWAEQARPLAEEER
ncbi:MAG: Trm112 family protein [Burkholderiaceae bacterium]|nr:Trm112 family protein [Burkholderiaceae bacterium]